MTSYLVATGSVHVTAAAADYLEDRIDPAEDHVVVIGVREAAGSDAPSGARDAERDAGDAANVARSRLAAAMPEIDLRDGEPTAEIEAAIDEHGPDVVVIGPHGGTGGPNGRTGGANGESGEVSAEANAPSGLGSTARDLLAAAEVPVVVVPVPTPDRRAQS